MDFNRYFKSRQGDLLNALKTIVALESPTSDKAAVDACAALVVREFAKIGAGHTRYGQDDIGDLHLFEYPPGASKKADERILVLLHVDTVWPVGKIGKMPFYVSGGKAFGPGALDMKAGIVMCLHALQALRQLNIAPRKRIAVVLNSAEETGHDAATALILDQARKSSLALCLEPAIPGGALKTERKGRMVVRLEARGKAAHAGAPSKGVSAIEELIVQLGRLKKIRTGETTANIGLVGGGDKPNIVAETAWAEIDVRFWKAVDRDRVRAYFRGLEPSLGGAKIKASFESLTPPLERSRGSSALFARAGEIAAGLGITLESGKTGGGSDGSLAASVGLPTLDGLGPDGDGIHAEHEHVLLPSLIARTALLTELLARL